MARRHPLLLLCALLALTSLIEACGPGLYDLPPPPSRDLWESTSTDPAEEERAAQRRYLAARTALLDLYRALSDEDWDVAWEMLSTETQSFLAFSSSSGDGKRALREGRLTLPDGTDIQMDPVDLFLVSDLRRLEDDHENEPQAETPRRKELFAFSADGRIKKVVLIYELDSWRVHRTTAPAP